MAVIKKIGGMILMFFSKNFLSINPIAVLEINRNNYATRVDGRSFHALSYRIIGDAVLNDSHGKNVVETGDLLFVPANLDYTTRNNEENMIVIHFLCDGKVFDRIIKFTPKTPLYFEKKFKKLLQVWTKKNFGYEYECLGIIYSILAMIEKDSADFTIFDKHKKLSEVVEYIGENFSNPTLSVGELASMCQMSETFFRKVFKENMGISPLKYINNLRLRSAVELLSSDYYSISEISEKTGFNSVYYFSTFIKKETGFSPNELRKYPDIYKIK